MDFGEIYGSLIESDGDEFTEFGDQSDRLSLGSAIEAAAGSRRSTYLTRRSASMSRASETKKPRPAPAPLREAARAWTYRGWVPISDRAVLIAENLLIRQHGAGAAEAARVRAGELESAGQVEGAETYQRIVSAIAAMQAALSAAVN